MKERILIIDDDNNIRTTTARILEYMGYEVTQADNGKTGVNLASQQRPDLILCDITMPELDGYDVLHLLSKNPETTIIPFIFLTAKSERLDYRKGMEMGADDYLIKPFTKIEILNAIESRLNKNEKRKVYFGRNLQRIDGFANPQDGNAELKSLIASRKIRKITKKQTLYYDGDQPMGIYLILDGSIKTIKLSDDGREFMTGLYKTGDYLGVNALLLDEVFNETAVATEDATVCMLPKDIISTLLKRYPEISHQFLRILSNNIREKEDQMLELAYHSVRKRLAHVLLRLSKQSDDLMVLKVYREELAAMVGTALETVSRTLSDFKDEGLIDKKFGKVIILDLNRLTKMRN